MIRRLHVAVVSRWYPKPDDPHSGVFVQNQVEVLAKACDVSVLVPIDASLRDVLGGPKSAGDVRIVPMPSWPVALPARALALSHALRAVRPDVVHAHLLVPDGLPALYAARRLSVPAVVSEHAGFLSELARSRRARVQIVETLRRAGAVVAPSERLARLLRSHEPRARVSVIGNPIDTGLFRPDPASPRDVALAASLSLGEAKGTDVLLRAWARAQKVAHLPPLVLVGAGPERRRVEALVDKLGLGERCELVGRKTRDELAALMRRASFFVSASRAETFAGVVAETIACGTPVVSTRVGGPEEYVTGDVGLLVDPGDESALADAIVRMAGDAPTYDPESLHRHVEDRYGYEEVRNRLLELYGSLRAG